MDWQPSYQGQGDYQDSPPVSASLPGAHPSVSVQGHAQLPNRYVKYSPAPPNPPTSSYSGEPYQTQSANRPQSYQSYQSFATSPMAISMGPSPETTMHGYKSIGNENSSGNEQYMATDASQPHHRKPSLSLQPHIQHHRNHYAPEASPAARRYSPMSATYAANPSFPITSTYPTQTHSASYMTSPNPFHSSPCMPHPHLEVPNPPAHPTLLGPYTHQLPRTASSRSLRDSSSHSQRGTTRYHPHFAAVSQPTSPARAGAAAGFTPEHRRGRGRIPKFVKVKSPSDLAPLSHSQPPFRRANPEGGFISPIQALTTHLLSTYRICNPAFKYESSKNPRRVLTKPSKGVKNDGYDNEDSDYILYVNDILGSDEGNHRNRYLILDVLGQGTFGQVVKCQSLQTQEVVAVKVIKNKTAYFNQSMMEVSVLDLLNKKLDKNDDNHLLRLKDTFVHKHHLCLAFELLSINLYELIKQNQFHGLSTALVRVFAQQLLDGLSLLNRARLIHCDLKPENILLKGLESSNIKIIDFGSACDERQTVYTYIQSRFYRSPEVILGLPYTSSIDMWSLGCILVELFLGLPLFPGSSEYNQVERITEMLGLPPLWMLEYGKQASQFFETYIDGYGRHQWRLKNREQYSREYNKAEQPSKRYFQATALHDIVRHYPMPRKNMKPHEVEKEMTNRAAFIDFVKGLLTIDPLQRWTPQQARLHPFIMQQKFPGLWRPPSPNLGRIMSPGLQQQQAAEMAWRQRMAAHAAHAAQAAQAAQNHYAYSLSQYGQQAGANMYGQHAYDPMGVSGYAPQQMVAMTGQNMAAQAGVSQMQYSNDSHQNLYVPSTHQGTRRRATTLDQHQASGIPVAFQRVASHLDPNAPIRLQPSPAYYPPLAHGNYQDPAAARRQRGRAASSARNYLIRVLEDGATGGHPNQWRGYG